ncbi:MAG TPA: hypothetical protein VE737_03750, partial [Actinomycetota bacterium]|nr:hypothetical protein [Actinomycetota bacterium]
EALDGRSALGSTYPGIKVGFVTATEAALSLGDTARVEKLFSLPTAFGAGETTPYWRAQASRLEARFSMARGESDAVEPGFKTAAGLFREIGIPFWLGVTLTEHGEWLGEQGRTDEGEPLLDEARGLFDRLGAVPWRDRADRAAGARAVVSSVSQES